MKIVRRWLVGSAVLLLVLALLGGAWLAYDRRMGRREWEHYREAALARGVKLTFRDYSPPMVSPEENYVTGTIFERLGSKQTEGAEPKRPLKSPSPTKANPKATLTERLEGSKAAMLEAGWLARDNLPPETGRAVLLGLERFRAELDQLRAARSRPSSRFPQSELPPPQTEFPQVLLAMDATSLLGLQIDARLAVRESAAALENLRDGLRLYRALAGEPTMIAGLGRQATLHILTRSVDSGLAARLWAEEDLRQVEVLLGSVDVAADARHAFSSERGFINDAAASQRLLPIWDQVAQIEAMDLLEQMPRGWRLWLAVSSGDQWRRLVLENRVLDHRLAQFGQGLDRAFENAPPDEVASEGSLTSMTDMIGKRYVMCEMALRQSRVVCALERFRVARSAYPALLVELIPEFIAQIPNDVIDGQPVRYRRPETGKFLLYSVGANARDDGGSTDLDQRVTGSFKALDWVWGELWK